MGRVAQLAMSSFAATIDTLLPEWPALPEQTRATVSSHCAAFVSRQIGLAPAHVRLGIRVLFLAFTAFAFLRAGLRPLGSMPRERRAALLREFGLDAVPLLLSLERVLRSLTMVAFLDHPKVTAAIDESAAVHRRVAVP